MMKKMDMIIILKGANYHLWKNKMEDPFFIKKNPTLFKEKKPDKNRWKVEIATSPNV